MGYFRPASLDRDAVDFLETGQAVFDLFKTRASQVPYAFFCGLSADFRRAAQRENDARDRLRYGQNLIDPDAALVAVGAIATALRPVDLETARHVGLGKTLF